LSEPAHLAPEQAKLWKESTMTNPSSRIAGLATSACLALAIIVGVLDSAQAAATITGTPAATVASFASVTPAVRPLA
jgi:hypothetical protein